MENLYVEKMHCNSNTRSTWKTPLAWKSPSATTTEFSVKKPVVILCSHVKGKSKKSCYVHILNPKNPTASLDDILKPERERERERERDRQTDSQTVLLNFASFGNVN
jgi:hypothetical protein